MNSEQYIEHLIKLSRDAFGAGVQTHHLNTLKDILAQEKAAPAPVQPSRNDYR